MRIQPSVATGAEVFWRRHSEVEKAYGITTRRRAAPIAGPLSGAGNWGLLSTAHQQDETDIPPKDVLGFILHPVHVDQGVARFFAELGQPRDPPAFGEFDDFFRRALRPAWSSWNCLARVDMEASRLRLTIQICLPTAFIIRFGIDRLTILQQCFEILFEMKAGPLPTSVPIKNPSSKVPRKIDAVRTRHQRLLGDACLGGYGMPIDDQREVAAGEPGTSVADHREPEHWTGRHSAKSSPTSSAQTSANTARPPVRIKKNLPPEISRRLRRRHQTNLEPTNCDREVQ